MADLLHPALMATSLERRVQEQIDNLQCCLLVDETGRQRHHIAVVVLAAQLGNFSVPAKGATDMGIFVHRHLYTVAAAADDDASFVLAFFDGTAQLVCIVGVVATLGAERAEVLHLKAFALNKSHHFLLQFVARMVAGDRYDFLHFSIDVDNCLRLQRYIYYLNRSRSLAFTFQPLCEQSYQLI